MTAKQHVVCLTPDQRAGSAGFIRRTGASAHEQRRARIVLHADVGPSGPRLTDVEIAAAVGVEARTVARVRSQFAAEGLEATVHRRPRGDARPRKLSGEPEARLVALACAEPPPGHARWTLRLLTSRLIELEIVESVGVETVRQTLKKRVEALAGAAVVSAERAERGLRRGDGGRVGGLCSPSRPGPPPGLLR